MRRADIPSNADYRVPTRSTLSEVDSELERASLQSVEPARELLESLSNKTTFYEPHEKGQEKPLDLRASYFL
jgi:hypothetical protein